MASLRQISLLIVLVAGLNLPAPYSWGSSLTAGHPAPSFLVESADGQKLSFDEVRGRVVVLFYENRHVIKQNKPLKDELTRLYYSQPAKVQNDIFRLVVIDCAEACLPTLPIWKHQLKAHSKKEGFTIYGDWQRNMLRDYCMQPDDSNFLIIDQQGIVRYSATGRIDPGQFDRIKKLLFGLLQIG